MADYLVKSVAGNEMFRAYAIDATGVVAEAIKSHGLEAAQYQVALKQVEALAQVAKGQGKQTIILPADAVAAFGDAFKLLKGGR